MTRTFTKVNRQYGQVMVGTDTAMVASLSLKGSECGEDSERRGGTSRTGDPRCSEKRSAAFGDGGVGVTCGGGCFHELAGDGAAVMSSAAAVGAAFGDRGPGVARRG